MAALRRAAHCIEQIRFNVPQKDDVNITFDNQQTHKTKKMRTRNKISNSSNAPDLKESYIHLTCYFICTDLFEITIVTIRFQ